jgi:hypoxanthine phosphoribosyltransferase
MTNHNIEDQVNTLFGMLIDDVIRIVESESKKKSKYKYLTYDEIQTSVTKICEELNKNSRSFDTILYLSRGGLIPAGMMAYGLDISNVVPIDVSKYKSTSDEYKDKGEQVVIKEMSKKYKKIIKESSRLLIIDDIIDSGDSMMSVVEYLDERELLKKADALIYTIVNKDVDEEDKDDVKHEICSYDLTGDDRWVVFPWDVPRDNK